MIECDDGSFFDEDCAEYRDELRAINTRIVDLMLPFSKRWI